MKHLRRILCLLLALVLCAGILPAAASATYGPVDTLSMACSLKAMGLFKGVSDTDFALDRAPTRAEALVMLLRLMGVAQEAAQYTGSHPFTDTADCAWADPYIAYAWDKGITKGYGTTFGGSDNADGRMYFTFVLRALGYSDADGDFSYSNPYTLARSIGIFPEGTYADNFMRGDVVLVSYAALTAKCKGSERTLAESLMAVGALSAHDYNLYFDPQAAARGWMKPAIADTVTLALDPDRLSRGIDTAGMVLKNYSNVFLLGDAMYEKYGFYPASLTSTAERLKTGAAAVAGQARVFVLGAPNRLGAVLSDDDFFRLSGSSATETEGNAQFYAMCGEGVYGVNIIDRLRLHNDENIFFRTDHHWTALGAYYAYTAWAEAAGFDPAPLSAFDREDRGSFYGSFYSAGYNYPAALRGHPDDLTVYVPRSDLSASYVDSGSRWTDSTVVYSYNNYGAFLLGDHQLVTITNNDIDDDSACVLVKDSYGNPFAVYLTQHYHTVYVVDYRHYQTMAGYLSFSQFVARKGVDDFIVLLPMSMQAYAAGPLAKYCW